MQTFPEDFAIVGAWGEAMRQLGNAVPVALAELFGKKLFALLSRKENLMKCNEVRAHPVTSRSQVSSVLTA